MPNEVLLFPQHSEARYGANRRRHRLVLPRFLAPAARQERGLAPERFNDAHITLIKWAERETDGSLQQLSETTLQADFLTDVFGGALGYTLYSAGRPNWNLQPAFSVPGGQADAALGDFSPGADPRPRVLIELKGPTVNLDRDRSAGRTPVQQLWDYLNAVPQCPWGVLCNYVSFRLYHRTKTPYAYELFTLQDLRQADRFAAFYAIFERGGLLPVLRRTPRADTLLEQSEAREREVGDELYTRYSEERIGLIHHLHRRLARPLDLAIHIAQKLLDRIIFVAFCEDRGLLQRDTIDRTWSHLPPFHKVTNPRWQNFLNLFRAVDTGHSDLGITQGYNGNLFKHDPEVDDLQLDDEWTKFFHEVGTYDFADEVNVDVLGHLFEQSITELEKLRAGGLFGLEEDAATGRARMPKSAERKRFGVYYTPPEFTGFLVDHTIGALVRDRFTAAAQRHGVDPDQPDPARDRPDPSRDREGAVGPSRDREGAEAATSAPPSVGIRDAGLGGPALLGSAGVPPADALRACWRDCLQILRDFKVCDPACGSGAFLIRAYDLLEQLYGEVLDHLARLGDPSASRLADQVPDLILRENLFGVDLSEEACEITRLALWIRSARPGRTLADLSRNIVCGNSLVDDVAVHPRAMNWRQTFPAVFGVAQPSPAESSQDGAQPGTAVVLRPGDSQPGTAVVLRPGDSQPGTAVVLREAGFDAVIGNPPWERLKLQEREFFSLSAPDIAAAVSAAKRRQMIARLAEENPELYERYQAGKAAAEATLTYARASGRYPLTGRGDINTYALFAELARSLVAPHGRAGILCPSGIATDNTTKDFFGELMSSGALVSLHDFENRRKVFPDVDGRFKFCTLVFGGSATRSESADFLFFAHAMEEIEEKSRHIPLTGADIALLNPNTRTCPIFRTRRDAEITKAIYRRVPILIDRRRRAGGNPWGVRFFTMFHQTNDAELFHTAEQLRRRGFARDGSRWIKGEDVFLPLYEAKMVQAYDHRAASVVVDEDNWVRQGQTAETSLVSHQNPEFTAEPRWWVDQAEVKRVLAVALRTPPPLRGRAGRGSSVERSDPPPTPSLEGRGVSPSARSGTPQPAYLCYKDVTSPTNERTMIAAMIPHVAVVNSAPLVLLSDELTARRQSCLLANLNTFVLDFVARQKVGGIHLNFFIVEQFPIFPPDAYDDRCPWSPRQKLETWISERVLKLTCTADDMRPLAEAAGFKAGVHKWKPDERARLMAELDAAYFHLYGVSRADAEYILSTFVGTRRRDTAEVGRFRTADLVLEAYDALATA